MQNQLEVAYFAIINQQISPQFSETIITLVQNSCLLNSLMLGS